MECAVTESAKNCWDLQLIAPLKEGAALFNLLQIKKATDKKRPEAIEFYESLRFVGTHVGFRLSLQNSETSRSTNSKE